MLFITSRQPTNNTEPELNTNFVFDLENNASSRGFFCCRRIKKDVHKKSAANKCCPPLRSQNTGKS